MAVLIGSARSSYGNTNPGDQNGGKEVSTEKWYLHSKGWVLLRALDPEARERIALAMERACANDDIGYSQGTRNTLFDNVKPYGYDPARTTKKVNTDCSALVRVCVHYAGITVGDFITSSEASTLMATGAFEKLTDSKYTKMPDYLMRGDILVTKTKGHTVVVLSNGAKAGQEAVSPAYKLGDRILKNGMEGADVKELQTMLDAVGEIVDLTSRAFLQDDLALARQVEPLEQVIDKLKDELRTNHIARLQRGECSLAAGFVLSDLLTNLERVSDHCSNIAGCLLDMKNERIDLHKYLGDVKSGSNEFLLQYNAFEEKYKLEA